MGKIAAINGKFENMPAFLAHIAEDGQAYGFCGVIMRRAEDGGTEMVPVHFEATCEQMSFAAAMMLQIAVKPAT